MKVDASLGARVVFTRLKEISKWLSLRLVTFPGTHTGTVF